MPDPQLTDEQLRRLIGRELDFEGKKCQVIEVLEDGPSLVVECIETDSKIQANQFGDGNRRVQQHRTIPVYSMTDKDQLNPDFAGIWQSFLLTR